VIGALEQETTALPVIPNLEPIPAEPKDLELLLTEVNALTLRLKQVSRSGDETAGLLSATQCVLRLLLEQGAKSVPQIARLRGTSRQNVQILVNRLRREGLVTLATNPAHRRSALVMLTEQGKNALASAANAEDDFAHALSPRCSQSEVRSAMALLRRLRDSIAERQTTPSVTVAATPQLKRGEAAQKVRVQGPSPFTPGLDAESSIGGHELPVSLL
jgi:DNA-binding MarR family transcriptional regulator